MFTWFHGILESDAANVGQKEASVWVDWVTVVVECVQLTLAVAHAVYFAVALTFHPSNEINKVIVVNVSKIVDAAKAFSLTGTGDAFLTRHTRSTSREEQASLSHRIPIDSKVGESNAEQLVLTQCCAFFHSCDAHVGVEKVV